VRARVRAIALRSNCSLKPEACSLPRMIRLPEPARDHDGLPIVGALERRVALALVWASSIWLLLVAAWEMFGPILAGHYAASASVGIIAENMLRWRIAGPVWEYTTGPPSPQQYYCHHPWGIFWTTAALMKIFGRHDFVCRLAPVLLSAATPALLHALGRALWRPAAGAAAAVVFVSLPIVLSFASFNALEVPVIAWTTLALWGWVRHRQTSRPRHLYASLAGIALALHADWPAYVLVACLLGAGLVQLFAPRLLDRVRLRTQVVWWMLAATLSVATFALYVSLFHRAGKLGDLLSSYELRARGSDAPLARVVGARRYWLELMFTPVGIALVKASAVVCAARVVLVRRASELAPLAVLAMASVQYFVFRQGADIHIYWPHYFAQAAALGAGAMVATIMSLATRATKREERVLALGLGPALLVAAIMMRDAVPALGWAHATGGRFDEKGLLIHSDGAKTAFLRWLGERLEADALVDMHVGMKTTWAQVWSLDGRVVRADRPRPRRQGTSPAQAPASSPADAYLVDTRFMHDDEQAALAAEFHVVAVGPFWWIDPSAAAAPIDAFAFGEREPSLLAWYFESGTEPVRTIAASPFATWELRTHFDQPAEPPLVEAVTLDERRVAHNVAMAAGDEAGAAALAATIARELDGPEVRFADGTTLLGTRFDDGARPLLTLVFRAAGPAALDLEPRVRGRMVARASWSLTMADPKAREVGLPLALEPRRWRRGWLYADRVPIRRRPGTEVFELSFQHRDAPRDAPPAPAAEDGREAVEVLRLDR
jgi:dolichyl-phosphate-mannose-protein mannosyltransferase